MCVCAHAEQKLSRHGKRERETQREREREREKRGERERERERERGVCACWESKTPLAAVPAILGD